MQTPNTVGELLSLNEKEEKKQLTGEEVVEVLDQMNPSQTILTVQLLLKRLERFHWEIVDEIKEGEVDQPLQPWVHDSTLISNCLMMWNNLTDFQE